LSPASQHDGRTDEMGAARVPASSPRTRRDWLTEGGRIWSSRPCRASLIASNRQASVVDPVAPTVCCSALTNQSKRPRRSSFVGVDMSWPVAEDNLPSIGHASGIENIQFDPLFMLHNDVIGHLIRHLSMEDHYKLSETNLQCVNQTSKLLN